MLCLSKKPTVCSILKQIKDIEENTKNVNMTSIGWSFLIIGVFIILGSVAYAIWVSLKEEFLSKKELRKMLNIDRFIQSVTTTYLVPVATSVMLQPAMFDKTCWFWVVFILLPACVLVLICSIISESKHQAYYDRITK